MEVGVRLACDVGRARIGIARCDPQGLLATPMPAVAAGAAAMASITDLASQLHVVEVIVGLPLRLDGTAGPAADEALQWARALEEALRTAGRAIPVRLVDERLTTVQAQRGLHAAGRSTRSSRQRIDSASAVVLLQAYLDRLALDRLALDRLRAEPFARDDRTDGDG